MKKLVWFETTQSEIDNNPNTFDAANAFEEIIEDDSLTANEAIEIVYENADIHLELTDNGEYTFTDTDGNEKIVCRFELI